MGRKKMGKNDGMLFDFQTPRRLSFWMRNTYLPLDIAFIDKNGKITEIKEMVPMSTKPVVSSESCKYALEVNRGWFDNNNVTIGGVIGGVGIDGTRKNERLAQMNLPPVTDEGYEQGDLGTIPQGAQHQEQQPDIYPDVMLNMSHKEILENAQSRGNDLIIMYVKKDGYSLPPKKISPPFLFEDGADGESESVVKAWDNQDAEWKSFLVDNIIDLQVIEDVEQKQENPVEKKGN